MSTNNQRSSSKERFWRRMVRRCRNSGLSVRAFCEEHGLSEPSFYAFSYTVPGHGGIVGTGCRGIVVSYGSSGRQESADPVAAS